MKKTVMRLGISAALSLPLALQAQEYPQLQKLSIGALQEFGTVSKPLFGSTYSPANENEWVDHFGAFITQSASVTERLSFDVGLGGIFQFQKPEVAQATWGGSQFREFYIGPTIADLKYRFGDPSNSWGNLQFGMFPYKYTQSSNLGEYLFRSGPYPTFLWTGGYAVVNSANANIQGARFNFTGVENLNVDLILSAETSIPPLYDFSLTALAKYTMGDGLLTVGGAVQFKRVFSVHPDSSKRENAGSSYFQVNGKYYTGYTDYYYNQATYWKAKFEKPAGEGGGIVADSLRSASAQKDLDSVQAWLGLNPADSTGYRANLAKEYYDAAGTTLLLMASLDGKKLVPSEKWGPRDLELYTEIALLGVKNYPIFYENRTERMPIMVGFNIPTMKALDLLSLEVEWFNSPWINSYSRLAAVAGGATPQVPSAGEPWYSEDSYNDVSDRDNLSWSLLAQKKILNVLTISGQVARDHARFVSRTNWFGPNVDPNEALVTSKDWYWMLQFSFGI